MQALRATATNERFATAIEASRHIRWDIERDVIRERDIDISRKFLPDQLSLVDRLDTLNRIERRMLSQVQGRTYANMLGLLDRFIGAKMLEVRRDHWLGDQHSDPLRMG